MDTSSNFLPSGFKMESTSNYMKFLEGANPFRALSSAVVGYEYFNDANKPVRSSEPFDNTPDIKSGGTVKQFWAFVVWNYNDSRIQILELTQKSIMRDIQNYINNPKWGTPKEYDIIVNRIGSGLETEYSVTVDPKSPVEESIKVKLEKMDIDLTALFSGKDPFKAEK